MSEESACVKCDSGCQDCDSCQAFCESEENSKNGFNFNESCLATGQRLFSLSTWNDGIKQINAVFGKGSKVNAASSKITEFSGTYLTAKEFNRVIETTSSDLRVNSGESMKGTYFVDLKEAIANLHYKTTQCDYCNAGCDTCDGCESCNSETTCCGCNDCDAESTETE